MIFNTYILFDGDQTMIFKNTFRLLTLVSLAFLFNVELISQESVIEDIIVTAEKRDESLQTVSQAVTALTDSELEAKNITSFVCLLYTSPSPRDTG